MTSDPLDRIEAKIATARTLGEKGIALSADRAEALVDVARAAREMSTLHDYCIVCRFPGGNHKEGRALARLDKEQP